MCANEIQVDVGGVGGVCQASKYTISMFFVHQNARDCERVTAWKCRNKQNTIRMKINYNFSLARLAADFQRIIKTVA